MKLAAADIALVIRMLMLDLGDPFIYNECAHAQLGHEVEVCDNKLELVVMV